MQKIIPALLVSTALLAACATDMPKTTLAQSIPAAWSAPRQGAPVSQDWWKNFNSPELEQLVAKALSDNADLKSSLHRIEAARADLKIAGASLLPSVDGSADASITRTNPSSGATTTRKSATAGLSVSYELDLFGGNRAAADSAAASLNATQYDHDALALVTMADTATAFFTLVNLRERIANASDNIINTQNILDIATARHNAGLTSELEVSNASSALASTHSALSTLQESEAKAKSALAILLGEAPQTISVSTSVLDAVSVPMIDAGTPSTLLQRRPDIAAAEANLIAADADIKAARAALYPSISIGPDFTLTKSPLGSPAATALSLAASLATPIFNGGRIEGGVEKAEASKMALLEDYRKTILTAFQETEDALATINSTIDREDFEAVARAEAQKAFNIAEARFKAGSTNLEPVLTASNTLIATRNAYSQARLARVLAAIDLYKALGGGWAP